MLLTVSSQAWDPPIGIPRPAWPDLGNPIEAVAPTPPASWTADVPGFYYVQSGGTNANQGYPGNPRNLIPLSPAAGSVVFINGTYSGDHRSLPITASGTSTKPVWILSYNPTTPCTAIKQWTIASGSSYLIVDHVNWDWSGASYIYSKMDITDCNHICFRNGSTIGNGTETGTDPSPFYNITTWGIDSSAYGKEEQIVLYNMHSTKGGNWQYANGDPDGHGVALGTFVQDLWVVDCEFSYYSGNAIQIGAGTTGSTLDSEVSRRIYVGRCKGHHIAQAAFWSKRAEDVIFSQNTAYTMRRDTPSSSDSGGIGAQYGPRNLWIIYNTVYDCQSGFSINSDSLGSGATSTDVYIIGNVFYNIHDLYPPTDDWRGNTYSQGGACISIWGGRNTYIVNNTFDDYDVGIISPGTGCSRFVDGNIFTGRSGSVSGGELILEADPNNANTLSYNIIEQINGACYVQENHGSAWQTVAAIAKGPGNSSTPPTYVNKVGRNYALQAGSNGIDKFTNTAHPVYGMFNTAYARSIAFDHSWTSDHAGVSRPQNGSWDIGAYEFSTGTSPKLPAPENPKVDFPK